mmetsp:Transcript_29220/g.72149  ORF Transcript_29220/g.72149 Transcript_29220/m.72149 type:complete len:208 (-) Transcript_29220:298-921(-)
MPLQTPDRLGNEWGPERDDPFHTPRCKHVELAGPVPGADALGVRVRARTRYLLLGGVKRPLGLARLEIEEGQDIVVARGGDAVQRVDKHGLGDPRLVRGVPHRLGHLRVEPLLVVGGSCPPVHAMPPRNELVVGDHALVIAAHQHLVAIVHPGALKGHDCAWLWPEGEDEHSLLLLPRAIRGTNVVEPELPLHRRHPHEAAVRHVAR